MPEKPATPCRACGARCRGGYCDPCRAAGRGADRHRRYNRDRWRGEASRERTRLYGLRKWRKLRAAFLRSNPLCVECLVHGRYVTAREVDHRVPHDGDRDLFFDWGNLQPLCKPCHSRKTARESAGGGGGAGESPGPSDEAPAL